MIKKLTWQQKAIEVDKFQRETGYKIREISDELGFSIGDICNCLRLVAAMKEFPELDKIKTYTGAVEFITKKGFRKSG